MTRYLADLFSLEGRVAVVTGASRGIGRALAEALGQAGAHVLGVGRSLVPDAVPLHSTYEACDVRDVAAFRALCEGIGTFHILVNAAGITLPDQHLTDPGQAFRDTVALNLTAAFDCCQIAAARMTAGGSIINVTSIGAHLGFPGNPGYAAAKGGLTALTRSLAADFAPAGIRVNNLVPGYIRTAMTEGSYQDPERNAARKDRTLLQQWGEPADLAGAAIFLASGASGYVTGTDLCVDGGWLVKGL